MAFIKSDNNQNNTSSKSEEFLVKKMKTYKTKVNKNALKVKNRTVDELGRTGEDIAELYKIEKEKKRKKEKNRLRKMHEVAHNIKMMLIEVKKSNKLNEMSLIELAQFYMYMCYFPGMLMKHGFKSKEQMVDAFYAVFKKLDKSQQQYIETRFQFEVDRMAKTQKMEMTDKAIINALYKKESTSKTLIKDTMQYISTTSIGNYSNRDTYTTTTSLENQMEQVGYSKRQVKAETKSTYTTRTPGVVKTTARTLNPVRGAMPQDFTATRVINQLLENNQEQERENGRQLNM